MSDQARIDRLVDELVKTSDKERFLEIVGELRGLGSSTPPPPPRETEMEHLIGCFSLLATALASGGERECREAVALVKKRAGERDA